LVIIFSVCEPRFADLTENVNGNFKKNADSFERSTTPSFDSSQFELLVFVYKQKSRPEGRL